jgi:hypothetical protein
MRYLPLGAVLLAAGCCIPNPQAPVFVEGTLARLELPERPTRIVRLSAGRAESTWYVLSRDHVADPPAIERSEATDQYPGDPCDEDSGGIFGRVDVCLAKRVSFGYSRGEEGPPMGHVMLYLAGPERERARPGDISLAVTGAWGEDDGHVTTEQSNGDTYDSRWGRKQRDVGLVIGARAGESLMFYGGPYRIKTRFRIHHERPGTAPQVSSGDITAAGWHVGLALFAGRRDNHSFLLELSRARVDAGDDDWISNTGVKYQFEFGGGSPAPAKKQPAPQSRPPQQKPSAAY